MAEGAADEAKKDWAKAIETYEKARVIRSDNIEPKIKFAGCRYHHFTDPRRKQIGHGQWLDLGYEADVNGNPIKGVEWYTKAAEAGDSNAIYSLGVTYGLGKGVAQDDKKAMELFKKAANTGHTDAMINLGAMYSLGRGVSQDYQKAAERDLKAVESENKKGMYSLGFFT
ncbi:MAG TPA: tetratricopeptide repeat protein [Sedimentisphaerales bacterium]|nr:tetratricopeptide repeat protein [Sedimentisphaerales bacterium]